MFFVIGRSNIQIMLEINHNCIPLLEWSINFPANHGAVSALIPKHWEYKAIAEPLLLIGDTLTIASEADGRNMQNAIVIGIREIRINKYPLIKRFESDKQMKPKNKLDKHKINFKDVFLCLIK